MDAIDSNTTEMTSEKTSVVNVKYINSKKKHCISIYNRYFIDTCHYGIQSYSIIKSCIIIYTISLFSIFPLHTSKQEDNI